MSYYQKVLRPEEEVHFLGRLHWIIYWRAMLFGLLAAGFGLARFVAPDADAQAPALLSGLAILAGLAAVAALAALLAAGLRAWTTEIVVTNLRVITKTGLVARHTVEMNITKIESVDVVQGLWARMLGFGTVKVRGIGAGLEPLDRVADPLALRNAIVVG